MRRTLVYQIGSLPLLPVAAERRLSALGGKDRLAGGENNLYTHRAGRAAIAIPDLQALGGGSPRAEGE